MIRTYRIFSEGDQWLSIDFDDQGTVRELVEKVFDTFGYYEPAGMDVVTLFACHSPRSLRGWFIIDKDEKCFDAFDEETVDLSIAYYKPSAFYYAEGGWGHHMSELGNHPHLEDATPINIRFDGFSNTVVIAGRYSVSDICLFLCATGYLESSDGTVTWVELDPTLSHSPARGVLGYDERNISIRELVKNRSFDWLEFE